MTLVQLGYRDVELHRPRIIEGERYSRAMTIPRQDCQYSRLRCTTRDEQDRH